MEKNIPRCVIARLPLYYHYLKSVNINDKPNISSASIAKALSLGEVQVRKDLAAVSGAGKPKIGYKTDELLAQIENIICGESRTNAVIIGAGKLGLALLGYEGFSEYAVDILAAFDTDEKKCLLKDSKPVLNMSELQRVCKDNDIKIGIITVPERFAQSVCDMLIQSGVKAILNFAPAVLKTPDNVCVKNVNVAANLATLLVSAQ